ncbi:putative choline transport protein [Glonium stellatum]|uniref:Putative choline transport protein n=1 Tax=Glonium stellatum TaxID=574774 RepID=A0A8E2JVU4_9PEZI|nr:putative choline transport protein [Glonium stellatum]
MNFQRHNNILELNISHNISNTSDEHTLAHFGKRQHMIQPFLFNGGPTGAITTYPIISAGVFAQILVMAELSSMIPLSGGQYNWVAILSPPSLSNLLSYSTGWILVIAWQSASASVVWLCSQMIIALASVNNPEYSSKIWHSTLISFAIVALGVLVNTYLGRIFPTLESLAFILHVVGFFVVLIVMIYLAPKADSSLVFNNFLNGGDFPNDAQSVLVGIMPSMYSFIGVDAATHIAEEIENSARVIPRAMIMTVMIHAITAYAMMIAVMFCMGSVDNVLTSTLSFPIITVFEGITDSPKGASVLVAIITVMTISGSIGLLATASRMLWAFAREDGVPFSSHISRIEPHTALPVYAISITACVSMLLALIGLSSTTTLNVLSGLTIAGFYSGFILSASMMLWRRLTTPDTNIPWGPFRLGKLGVPVTVFALAYSFIGWLFSFWPSVAVVSVKTFNWSLVVYFGVMFLAMGWWAVRARKTYKGPKMEISSH